VLRMKTKNWLIILTILFLTLNTFALEPLLDRNSTIADIRELTPSTENIKTYDERTDTARIISEDGLTDLAEIKLLTPKHNKVFEGYQKVAEFEVTGKANYTDFIKQIYFFDIKREMQGIKRGFDLRYEVPYTETEKVFERVCEDYDKNINCTEKETGTRQINKTRYDLLTEKNFLVETKKVSIWTNVNNGDYVEWIPDIYGTLITEWATWESITGIKTSFENGTLASNADMNWIDTSANQTIDTINWLQGLKSMKITGSTAIYANSLSGDKNYLYFWAKTNDASTSYQSMLIKNSTGTNLTGLGINNSGEWSYGNNLSGILTTFAPPINNRWYLFKIAYKDSGSKAWFWVYDVNGMLVANGIKTDKLTDGAKARAFVFSGDTNGYFDAIAYTDEDYNATTFPLSEPAVSVPIKRDLNVVYAWNKGYATSFNLDCNNNFYDANGINTVYSITTDQNTVLLCNIDKTGYASLTNKTIRFDINATTTFYLNDNIAPTIGTMSFENFTIYGAFIKGTGNIYAPVSDTGSGYKSSACQYSVNNGTTWASASDSNSTGCKKNSLTIANTTIYKFDLNGYDNNNNRAMVQSISYTGDTNAPTTYFTSTSYPGSANTTIHLDCIDANSGCATTQYRIDGGAWTTYSGDFNYSIGGHHTIDYNSTDNLGNVETYKTSDWNSFVLVTVKYPINEQTLVQITEKWRLTVTIGTSLYYTDLNSDLNIYLPVGITNRLSVVDVNGNYFSRTYDYVFTASDTNAVLQPYLVPISTGLLTTINAISATTNQPIQNVTFKIYTDIPGSGETLVENIITDSKGQGLILMVLNDSYYFDAYYDGNFIKRFTITATSATIFFILSISDVNLIQPTASGFNANWTPGTNLTLQTSGTQVFTQTLNNLGLDAVSIASTLTQNGANLAAPQNYVGFSNKTFTYTINWSGIVTGTIVSKMVVTASDGNVYTFTQNINVIQGYGEGYNPLVGASAGLRSDCGCDSNPLIPCYPLLILAVLICIGITLWASIQFGAYAGQSTGLIFLIGMILFTFLTWIPVWVTAGLVIIILAFIVNERR